MRHVGSFSTDTAGFARPVDIRLAPKATLAGDGYEPKARLIGELTASGSGNTARHPWLDFGRLALKSSRIH